MSLSVSLMEKALDGSRRRERRREKEREREVRSKTVGKTKTENERIANDREKPEERKKRDKSGPSSAAWTRTENRSFSLLVDFLLFVPFERFFLRAFIAALLLPLLARRYLSFLSFDFNGNSRNDRKEEKKSKRVNERERERERERTREYVQILG